MSEYEPSGAAREVMRRVSRAALDLAVVGREHPFLSPRGVDKLVLYIGSSLTSQDIELFEETSQQDIPHKQNDRILEVDKATVA